MRRLLFARFGGEARAAPCAAGKERRPCAARRGAAAAGVVPGPARPSQAPRRRAERSDAERASVPNARLPSWFPTEADQQQPANLRPDYTSCPIPSLSLSPLPWSNVRKNMQGFLPCIVNAPDAESLFFRKDGCSAGNHRKVPSLGNNSLNSVMLKKIIP